MKKSIVIVIIAIIAALAARLLYLGEYSNSILFSTIVGADVEDYFLWAQRIISGELIYKSVQIHPPAYPYFLAALLKIFNSNFFWLRFTQSFLCFLSFVPLYPVIKKQNNKLSAIIFLLLAALSPALIFFQCETYSESLLLIALNLSILYLYKYDEAAGRGKKILYASVAGLFCALAILTHSLSLIFVAIVLIYLIMALKNGENPIPFFACLAVVCLCLLPVVMYNLKLADRFIFTQGNSAFNFYLGNNAEASGLCPLRTGAQWDKMHYQSAKAAKERDQHIDDYFASKSLDYIHSELFHWLLLGVKKGLYVWNFRNFASGYDLKEIKEYTGYQKTGRFLDIFIIFGALCFLLFKLRDRKFLYKNRHFMFLLLGFYLAQIISLTAGRYRLGMYGAFLLLCSGFLHRLYDCIRNRKMPEHKIWALGSVIIAAAVVFIPSPVDNTADASWANSIIAEAYVRNKNLRKAEEHAARAVRECDENDRAYMILAACAMQKKQLAVAEQLFEKALKINEYSYQTQVNLALCVFQKGDRYLAQGIFLKCLQRWPRNPTVLYNYGYFLLRCGETAGAEKHFYQSLKYNPANPRAFNALGIICLNSKRYRQAIVSFEKALEITPGNFGVRFNLTAAQINFGLLDLAKRNTELLERQKPGDRNVAKLRKVIEELQNKRLRLKDKKQ